MPYSTRDNKYTLIVYQYPNGMYKLSGMMTVETAEGDVWMEPYDVEVENLVGMKFHSIEFQDPQGTDVSVDAGPLAMNHFNPDMNVGSLQQ